MGGSSLRLQWVAVVVRPGTTATHHLLSVTHGGGGGTEVYGKTIADMSVFIPYMSHVWDKFLPTKVFRGGVKIISLSLYKHCN